MKPKVQHKSYHQWVVADETMTRKDDKISLPSLTMKTSQLWPVVSEFKPYAGPTLWTPWYAKEDDKKYPFLTLMPTGDSRKHSIPHVSVTPRLHDVKESSKKSDFIESSLHGSISSKRGRLNREALYADETPKHVDANITNNNVAESTSTCNFVDSSSHGISSKRDRLYRVPRNVDRSTIDNVQDSITRHDYIESPLHGIGSKKDRLIINREAYTTAVTLPPINSINKQHLFMESHGHSNTNHLSSREMKRKQSPIIPDVFSLPISNHQAKRAPKVETLSKMTLNRNQPVKHDSNVGRIQWSFEHTSKGEHGIQTSLPDRNDQDKGTLFSKQHKAMYSRVAREPTFLPVPKNEILPHQHLEFVSGDDKRYEDSPNSREDENPTASQPKSRNCELGLSKQQRRARRNYIRSHAHIVSKNTSASTVTLGCLGHQSITDPSIASVQEADIIPCRKYRYPKYDPNSQITQPSDDAKRLQTRLVSNQFCDVLGQKTCRRCQEFYDKNFSQPPKEKAEGIRTPGILTRESTVVDPVVGLQKVVIRVKDDSGKMAIASVGVNPGLI